MTLLPYRFLLRCSHPCPHIKKMPLKGRDELLNLPDECRIDNFAAIENAQNFADVRLAWNEHGIGLQIEVRGKDELLQGAISRPKSADGVTLWLDTRDSRTSHRASRFCHQFHFLATGGGDDRDEPAVAQTKINRALHDAPLAKGDEIPIRRRTDAGGYVLEAFLPSSVLTGYDPEQNQKLGFYYVVRDNELGDQTLSVGSEFPYWEDPSLWSVLELQSPLAG